ncbi:S8/S53 family peptidase [Kribbella sp. NBC_00382]|uniref:S8/S53 family peptidase n=1 Tax=Kribbella sp. NBC_00382 TaxID=2975967 RepID=UPI002E1C6101
MQQDNSGEKSAAAEAKDVPDTPWAEQRRTIQESYGRGRGKAPWRVAIGTGAGDTEFLYEEGVLLVRQEYFYEVRAILVELGLFPSEGEQGRTDADASQAQAERQLVEPVLAGLRLVRLSPERDIDTIEVLEYVTVGGRRDINGRSVSINGAGRDSAALNHVVPLCGNGAGCPATEPEPVPAVSSPYPGYTPDRGAGDGVKVVVVDTGFDAAAPLRSPWLEGVTGDADYAQVGDTLEKYAGHGTFIAGLIRCVAPRAEVVVRGVLNFGGSALESDLVMALDSVLNQDYPDIISMSAGTHAYDATGLLSFRVFNELRLSHHKGVALVVAAGNDSSRKPFWPAASPFSVSVGALSTSWQGRAPFSNFGGWVDVYAPGQDLVNAFPVGSYQYHEPPNVVPNQPPRVERFYGMARWSGTSFSTPIVAGLIAARMTQTGENGTEAAAALIKEAQQNAQPGVGAVLLPE